jgi:pyruvate,water dikinase
MIRAFSQLTKEQAFLAGGKGRVLARLYQVGYRIPDGFIIFPDAFTGDELNPEAWPQVQAQLTRLRHGGGEVSFAMRSSALEEDSAPASFAGEFETVLDLRTDAEIRAAIHTVRRSRQADRVQAYRRAQGLDAAEPDMSVVVQRLIRADFSGVLFTANPLTGDLMHMTGNFVEGPGEKLVSGQANAQIFTFDRPTGIYRGPTALRKVARELYRQACCLEKELGGPQDIEWAVEAGRLYILQARPITTFNGYKPDTCEWNDSLRGNFLWTGANTGEAVPHVLTPFSASVQKSAGYRGITFSDGSTWGLPGYPFAGIIGGRAYVNLSLQVSAFRRLFGDSRKALRQLSSIWGDLPAGIEIPLIPIPARQWWFDVLPHLLAYGLKLLVPQKELQQFVAESPQWCAGMVERIKRIGDPAELKALFIAEIVPRSQHGFFLALASGNTVNFASRLEDELRGLVGAEDANALLSNLSGLSGELESLGPVVGLARVARGELSRAVYLDAYGHRGENETEYAWPRPLEDPGWLDRQLAEFARTPVDVEALLARQRAAFVAAWQRFRERHPRKVKSMQRRLDAVAQAVRRREKVRSEAVRSALAFRAYILRAGELTDLGEDVFFLTAKEVYALLDGDKSACRLIPLRRETYERYRALPPYPTIIIGRFDPFRWAVDPNRRSDIYNANAPMTTRVDPPGNTLTGFPGALGVVEGTVRRLERMEDSTELQPGEILVTKLTNIGWTPIFPRAAAIITDLGAPLSHATIVARELGIPAVVGCGDATLRLKTGDRVRVNGGQGRVEILRTV